MILQGRARERLCPVGGKYIAIARVVIVVYGDADCGSVGRVRTTVAPVQVAGSPSYTICGRRGRRRGRRGCQRAQASRVPY